MLFRSVLFRPQAQTVVSAACLIMALTVMQCAPTAGEPVTAQSAASVVANWLAADGRPLGARMGSRVAGVETYRDSNGESVYFVARVQPSGFVIVSADDLVEPIIAFSPKGRFDPSPDNPLGALVNADLPSRIEAARGIQAMVRQRGKSYGPGGRETEARGKWQRFLTQAASQRYYSLSGASSLSDPRVDPLIASKWDQEDECGNACYNYYTPPGPDGSGLNYSAGCVAIAMAQVMRFYQYPGFGVGTLGYDITVCGGAPLHRNLRGGDGFGGPYDWSSMVLDPDCSTTLAQRQAIGALCHDTGVAAETDYCDSGSGATAVNACNALLFAFYYSNAKVYPTLSTIPLGKLYKMVNPNLHAGWPAILGITRTGGGHMVVCDGYGYNASTQYHHLNVGWAGLDDAWYNLPTIDTSQHTYTAINGCIYNVYTDGMGEIISGRVTDAGGNPVAGAAVSSGSYSDTTDARGLYALAKVPSNTVFAVHVQKNGSLFADQSVTTGYSQSGASNAGNLWGIDFAPLAPVTVSEAKKKADGSTVGIEDVGVSAVFGDWFYVESADRSSGILVTKAGHGLSVGRQAGIVGLTSTNGNGERYLQASTVNDAGQADVVPLGIWSRALGGTDWYWALGGTGGQRGIKDGQHLNNIGLLVTYWGSVTYSSTGSTVAYVDDGAFLEDGNTLGLGGACARGVRIVLPNGVTAPSAGALVRITGVSSMASVAGSQVRCVKVRSQSDIVPIP